MIHIKETEIIPLLKEAQELVISLCYGREVQERRRYPIATYILTA